MVPSVSLAIGSAKSEWEVVSYSPRKPSLLPYTTWRNSEPTCEPSLFVMRASRPRAAVSAAWASAMRASMDVPRSSGAASSRSRPCQSSANPPSGSPATGSGAVQRASPTASSAMRSTAAGERSLVEVMAERRPSPLPTRARMPSTCSRACTTVSVTSPRTLASSESLSTSTASTASAPFCFAVARARSITEALIPRCLPR